MKNIFTLEQIHIAANGNNKEVAIELDKELDELGIENLALWLSEEDFFVPQDASPSTIKADFCFWYAQKYLDEQ